MHFLLPQRVVLSHVLQVLGLILLILPLTDDELVLDEVPQTNDHFDGQDESEEDEQTQSDEEL